MHAVPVDVAVLPAFMVAVTILVISPGPDLVLISTYSSAKGFRAGLLVSIGIFAAGLVQTGLVAFGLGNLMSSAPAVATAVRTLGALYLAGVGLGMLRKWFRNRDLSGPETRDETYPASGRRLVARGLWNNLLNPKALVFFSVFLPQFTVDTRSIPVQIVVLGLLLSTSALAVNTVAAFSFSRLAQRFGQRLGRTSRHIEGLLGAVFVGLAIRLATDR